MPFMAISRSSGPDLLPAMASPAQPRRYLFSPVIDFLCLGGSSLVMIPLAFLTPPENYRGQILFFMVLVSHAINHPHFAHSYQIFYRDFRAKLLGEQYTPTLRARYTFAGIAVPIMLSLFLGYSTITLNPVLLSYAANAMGFFVGWHYVKQGYGMLMVDSALKRLPFTRDEKKILRVNGYAIWVLSWLVANNQFKNQSLWGITYHSFDIPDAVIWSAVAFSIATSIATIFSLVRAWKNNGRGLPYTGVVAYVTSLYVWLLLIFLNPLWLIVTPALHSLQYMAVVYRFELNYENGQVDSAEPATLLPNIFKTQSRIRVLAFASIGLFAGFCGFWMVPVLLNWIVKYDQAVFGPALFMFAAWIMINIHHYFIDSVMWRRDNPDTRKYLFG
jgi:hypothetical protein